MKVTGTVSELQSSIRSAGLSPVGLVPTMGALHEGHLSLVRIAQEEAPLVVVTIYVNPTQFNDKQDLKNYPRTMDADLAMLKSVLRADDLVFAPEDKEIYPVEDKREFRFGNLDEVMEALHRPGHFNGVAKVVSRLFDIVKPDLAFFGQKDFQQLAVIKALVRQTKDRIRIVSCPIIREKDGLAMSSRNRLLEPEIRKNAGIIYKTLLKSSAMTGESDIPEIRKFVKESIERLEGFSVEYFEIVDDEELMPVSANDRLSGGKKYFACIAVKAGRIRLIDNIEIQLKSKKG